MGSAISDKSLLTTKPLYTYILKSGQDLRSYPRVKEEFNLNVEFFMEIEKVIRDNKIRGLVVGYPLQENKPVIIY